MIGPTNTIILCENKSVRVSCGLYTVIHVIAANYGRTAKQPSCGGPVRTTNCRAGSSLEKVRRACNGKEDCSVRASNGVFGDPCGGTAKYLSIRYQCIAGTNPRFVITESLRHGLF